MNDWKKALKSVRKDLFGPKELDECPTYSKNGNRGAVLSPALPKRTLQNSTPQPRIDRSAAGNRTNAKLRFPNLSRESPTIARSLPTTEQPRGETRAAHASPVKVPAPKPRGVPPALPSPIRKTLTRQSFFKLPEAWVIAGCQTQLRPEIGTVPVDVVIGLDFGTSYTKAAISLKDQIFVIRWEGVSKFPEQYLLPSEFTVLDDEVCHIGQAPEVSFEQVRQRLKHPFIDAAVSTASVAAAAVFVALVLRYIRAWVFRYHREKIGTSQIRWLLNIGAPSNGLENHRLEVAYKKLGSVAWEMSLHEMEICPKSAQNKIIAWSPETLPRDLTALHVLPEFVAQIAGYVQSSQRRPGLHGLVDIGGGTLDVVTFIVHEREGEDVFPFLVPEVKALGTQMLYWNRLVDAPVCDESVLPDELAPVLDAADYARVCGFPAVHVQNRDEMLWNAVRGVVYSVFLKTKRKRYRLSPAWSNGLPTFLTGGGGPVDGYRQSVRSGAIHCSPNINLMQLPLHPRLAEFSGGIDEYQRLSVACGLAQDAFSLGQLIPAGAVDDDVPPISTAAHRPDRDELYGK
jgi:hypothetical protein